MALKSVSVYSVTRHFGGPEEGGWWYDWFTPEDHAMVEEEVAETRQAEMIKQLEPKQPKRGRYSMAPTGPDYVVLVEDTFGENTTFHRPHYE